MSIPYGAWVICFVDPALFDLRWKHVREKKRQNSGLYLLNNSCDVCLGDLCELRALQNGRDEICATVKIITREGGGGNISTNLLYALTSGWGDGCH